MAFVLGSPGGKTIGDGKNYVAVANARIRAIGARVIDLRDVFIEYSVLLQVSGLPRPPRPVTRSPPATAHSPAPPPPRRPPPIQRAPPTRGRLRAWRPRSATSRR